MSNPLDTDYRMLEIITCIYSIATICIVIIVFMSVVDIQAYR